MGVSCCAQARSHVRTILPLESYFATGPQLYPHDCEGVGTRQHFSKYQCKLSRNEPWGYQNRNILNATAKFLWERVERLLDYLCEIFTLRSSPTEINKGPLTPSSRRRLRRHHRRLLCRRLHLPLRLLPRLAPVEGGHRQLPTDQKCLSRGILHIFCSCPMVRLALLWQRSNNGRLTNAWGRRCQRYNPQ